MSNYNQKIRASVFDTVCRALDLVEAVYHAEQYGMRCYFDMKSKYSVRVVLDVEQESQCLIAAFLLSFKSRAFQEGDFATLVNAVNRNIPNGFFAYNTGTGDVSFFISTPYVGYEIATGTVLFMLLAAIKTIDAYYGYFYDLAEETADVEDLVELLERFEIDNGEASFTEALSAYVSLESYFKFKNINCDCSYDKLAVGFDISGRGREYNTVIEVDVLNEIIRLVYRLPETVQEQRIIDAELATCMVNCRLTHGNFDYNREDGVISFRLAASYKETHISNELIDHLIDSAKATLDKYENRFTFLSLGLIGVEKFFYNVD